jgi:hypothetical protein
MVVATLITACGCTRKVMMPDETPRRAWDVPLFPTRRVWTVDDSRPTSVQVRQFLLFRRTRDAYGDWIAEYREHVE